MHSGRGERGRAAADYRRAIALSEGLLAANPASALMARNLSTVKNRLGRLLDQGGAADRAAALSLAQDGLAVAERLFEADPESAPTQQDRSLGYERMARLAGQCGDPSAQDWWCKALAAIEAMQQAGTLDPADARFVDYSRGKLQY